MVLALLAAQLAAVSLVGATAFYFFGNAIDVTEKIDREIAERRGSKATDVDRGIARSIRLQMLPLVSMRKKLTDPCGAGSRR